MIQNLSHTNKSNITISKYSGTQEEFDVVFTSVNLARLATDPTSEQYKKDEFRNLLTYGKKKEHCFVIREGQNLIGSTSIISSVIGLNDAYKVSAISDFAIIPKYQSKGYGKKALLCIIEYIRKYMNNKDIGLGVAESNSKAVSLYKSVGFKIVCNANLSSNDRLIFGYQMLLNKN